MSQNKITVQIVSVLFVLIIKMSLFSTGLSAQGTLGRIRKSVRKEDAKKEEKSESPKKEKKAKPKKNQNSTLNSVVQSVRRNDRNQHSSHSNSHSGNHRSRDDHRHHRRRNRNQGIYFSSQAFCPQPQVIEHIHVYDQAPLIERPIATPGQTFLIEDTGPTEVIQSNIVADEPWYEDGFDEWSLRMTAYYGSNFDHLSQGGFNLLVQPSEGLGMDIGVATFRERGFAFRDHLWLGDVNVVFGSSLGDLRTRIGLGVNWLADPFGSNAGFNLTAGLDKSWGARWTTSAEIDFGSIGDTDLLHTQVSLGYRMGHSEIVAGYDYYNIGGTGIDGWFSGIRFRF